MKKNRLFASISIIIFVIFFSSYNTSVAVSKVKQQAKNPSSISVLVNKNSTLSYNYMPSDLLIPNVYGTSQAVKLRKIASIALEKMFKHASLSKIKLLPISGFRSYNVQKVLFSNKTKKYGSEQKANNVSARPGESEHQTGLAVDISSKSVNYGLVPNFYYTKEGQWLKNNCATFGFILRYPKNKTSITGYSFEPWHYRYVGVVIAKEIMKKGITLEEYVAKNLKI